MTIHLGIPLAVAVVGGIIHLTTSNKWSELGRLAWGAGLLAFLLSVK
jgi:hypothetical protein